MIMDFKKRAKKLSKTRVEHWREIHKQLILMYRYVVNSGIDESTAEIIVPKIWEIEYDMLRMGLGEYNDILYFVIDNYNKGRKDNHG